MYAIVDIETTGGKYNEEGITEIAIHKFDGHEVVDIFISLINPEKEIQPFVVNLTGINNHMLRTAPKFYEVAKRIVEITENTVIVAHNAQFDYRILRTEFRRLGFEFERKTLCTVDLSKSLLPDADSYSLGKLVRSLGIPVSDRHRANGDALATLKLFKLLLSKDLDKSILKSIVREESTGELSPKKLDIVERLPSETGIYYLYNKDGEIIYLGKSRNIKKRVNQHFTSAGGQNRKIQKGTRKVTFEKTGSELVAFLKESEELARIRPMYNLSSDKKLFSHALFQSINEAGYIAMEIDKIDRDREEIITFNSPIAASNFMHRITDEFQLCDKLNGLSQAKKNCSKYNEKKCFGACIQKEEPKSYNKRVLQAIKTYSIANRNIIIIDKGRTLGERSVILIKDGVFKGIGFCDLNYQVNNKNILESVIVPMQGNGNTNYIIESFLRKSKRHKIVELNP